MDMAAEAWSPTHGQTAHVRVGGGVKVITISYCFSLTFCTIVMCITALISCTPFCTCHDPHVVIGLQLEQIPCSNTHPKVFSFTSFAVEVLCSNIIFHWCCLQQPGLGPHRETLDYSVLSKPLLLLIICSSKYICRQQ